MISAMSPLAAQPSTWHPNSAELNSLVQRFRPYLKFSTGNRQEARPLTWQYLYEHSKLLKGDSVVADVGGLAGNGAQKALQVADVTKNPADAQSYKIVIDDGDQYGESWAAAEEGDGLYAHVIWLKDVTNTPTSANLVNIEYWLLFGFNVGYVPAEDHKGDLIGIQVVYDHVKDKLVRVAYSEHGKTLIMFDLLNSNPEPGAQLHGKRISGEQFVEDACKITAQSKGFYAGGLSGGPGIFQGGDNHLFLVKDPGTQKCEHPALYIEHGSHEPWPNQSGYYIGVASHNGDDVSFLPKTAHVLGPGDDPYVKFGGNFGDPAGPMRHRMWLGFVEQANPADANPYLDHESLKWLPTLPLNR
jgi:hypothetical protein